MDGHDYHRPQAATVHALASQLTCAGKRRESDAKGWEARHWLAKRMSAQRNSHNKEEEWTTAGKPVAVTGTRERCMPRRWDRTRQEAGKGKHKRAAVLLTVVLFVW